MSGGEEDPVPNRDHTVIRVPHRKRRSLTRKRTKRMLDSQCRRVMNRDFLLARFPCVEWALNYDLDSFFGDVIAGLTTALTVIPQGIGYAPLAGLPLQVWYLLLNPKIYKNFL